MVPYVTATLRIVHLPAPFAAAAGPALRIGTQAAYRLTPAVYARLHNAADRHLSRPGTTPESARTLIDALDRVYATLVAHYPPADVHPFDPARTPPLPELPRMPPDPETEGTPACDLDRGVISGDYARWCIRGGGPNPMRPAEAVQSSHGPERPATEVRARVRPRSKRDPSRDQGGLF